MQNETIKFLQEKADLITQTATRLEALGLHYAAKLMNEASQDIDHTLFNAGLRPLSEIRADEEYNEMVRQGKIVPLKRLTGKAIEIDMSMFGGKS